MLPRARSLELRLLIVSLSLVSVFVGAACGSSSSGASKGSTQCGTQTCSPGNYCEDARFDRCSTGCASEVNCSDGETCVKGSGQDTGSCRATAPAPTQAPTSTQSPAGECSKMPAFDSSCSGAGLPPKAYKCPVSAAAPQSQCVAAPDQKTYPGGWCCPS